MKELFLGFMLGVLITGVLNFSAAHASQTLSLEDEYRDGNHKVCVYSNGRQTEYVEKSYGGACPSKKYFY